MNVVRILVLDDERVIADTLTIILNSAGYECTAAYDGVDGVEKARLLRPQFIVMDLVMPRMSGAEAGQVIWAEQPDCKIVFMTGVGLNEHLLKERFGSGGYVLYWKPFDPKVLLQKLREDGFSPPLRVKSR